MEGYRKICVIVLCIASVHQVTSTLKESLHIPEKIIGGVIDIVQSHKNKPLQGQQQNYPPNYQYPQYQQWNGQSNFQNQGFSNQPQYQGQYQNQAQYQNQGQYQSQAQYQNQGQYSQQNGYNQMGNIPNNNYPQGNNNFPQGGTFQQNGGNFASNQGYPSGSGQSFNQVQGQYQGAYQNPNQFNQNNQIQTTQSGYYTQTGTNGQYPGQSGFSGQGSGQGSQGFFSNSGQHSGQTSQGPTCVCQAWTKPGPQQDILADVPVTEKIEKKVEPAKEA